MASSYATVATPAWPPDIRSDLAFVEKALVFAGLMLFMGTFRTMLSGAEDRSSGNLLFQLVSGGIYLSGIVILVQRGIPRWLFVVLLAASPLVVLTFLPLVSTLWSLSPSVTMRRAIALILTASFAAYIVARFDLRTLLHLIVGAYLVFIVIGIASAAAKVGITGSGSYVGAWQGLTGHKNEFGRTIALGSALLPIAALLGLTRWRYAALVATPVALGLLALSQSVTALFAMIGGLGVGTMFYVCLGGKLGSLRIRTDLGIPLLIIGIIAIIIVLTVGVGLILEAVGRDPTLSGRTKLWNWVIHRNGGPGMFGTGYRAFWIDSNTRYFFEYFQFWHMDSDGNSSETYGGPTHSHSGYVDVFVEMGYVGVTFLIAMFIWAIVGLKRALSAHQYDIGFVFSFIFGFQLIYITTERSVMQQSDDLWFFFMTFYLLTIRQTLFSTGRLMPGGEAVRP